MEKTIVTIVSNKYLPDCLPVCLWLILNVKEKQTQTRNHSKGYNNWTKKNNSNGNNNDNSTTNSKYRK